MSKINDHMLDQEQVREEQWFKDREPDIDAIEEERSIQEKAMEEDNIY